MSDLKMMDVMDLLEKAHNAGFTLSLRNDELIMRGSRNKQPDPLLLNEIKDSKGKLIEYLRQEKQLGSAPSAGLLKAHTWKDTDRVPLSFGQERLWFIDQLQGSQHYHLPWIFGLNGPLDKGALEFAFREILRRHAVLRTVIREEDGSGYQVIIPAESWTMQYTDAENVLPGGPAMAPFIHELVESPFDLSRDHMLRVHLIRVGEQEHKLVVVMHHIAFDGWSVGIMSEELSHFYNSRIGLSPSILRPLPVQYADYAAWQRTYLSGNMLDERLGYWKQRLSGVEPLKLPADHTPTGGPGIRGSLHVRFLNKSLQQELSVLCQQERASLFMVLLAAFKVLLYRYSGQVDICVGSPIAGRQHQELEGVIGFFVNTLALRSDLSGDPRFSTLLQQVRETTLGAYEYQDVPIEKVVEAVVRERNPGGGLFRVLFVLQNTPKRSELRLGEMTLSEDPFLPVTSKFDLTLYVSDFPDVMEVGIEYCTDLFEEGTIARMAAHYEQLLKSIVADPTTRIGELRLLTGWEEQQLLKEFNDTEAELPPDKTIVDLFREQVLRTPDGMALESGNVQVSYRELDKRSDRLSAYLRSLGVGPDQLVGVCMERSNDLVLGIWGILKSGGAYVPIDPDYPAERIAYLLSDTQVSIVVSNAVCMELLVPYPGLRVVDVNAAQEIAGDILDLPVPANVKAGPGNLAYVLYTSGSTGAPKGVMIEHRSLVNYSLLFKDYFSIGPKDRILQQSSPSFDTMAEELYPGLLAGACICILREGGRDIAGIRDYIEHKGATILSTTPMVIGWLNNELPDTGSLRYLISGGDRLAQRDVDRLWNKVSIVNTYGPTETTVCVTYNKAMSLSGVSDLGKPVRNTRIYIVDSNGALCPMGVVGEILVGGAGLARGYWRQEALTAERFVWILPGGPSSGHEDFPEGAKVRVYRTGDLGRWLPDGTIGYMGRSDDQVKIRGYRVELAEVERVLEGCPEVHQAVVMAREDGTGVKRLIGYVVPRELMDRGGILSWLRDRLPEYMVPSVLMELDNLPLNNNGKVDKQGLPPVDWNSLPALSAAYEAPRSETEQKLSEIWAGLLGLERVGVRDDFFVLGGHSLLAMRVVSAIRRDLGREVSIRDLFRYPTIVDLGGKIDKEAREKPDMQEGQDGPHRQQERGIAGLPGITAVERGERVPLSYAQERLWFIDALHGSVQYHIPFVLRLQGALDQEALEWSFRELVTLHEVLRTVILSQDGVAWQEVKDPEGWAMQYRDRRGEGTDILAIAMREELLRPFDLGKDYMLRVILWRVRKEEYLLGVVLHHIAADGWSIGILSHALGELYASRRQGRPPGLEPLTVQYGDYALWQRRHLTGELLQGELAYWKGKLSGTGVLELPLDHARPSMQPTRGGEFVFRLDPVVYEGIMSLCRGERTTIFMGMLAAFKALLYRYSGQEDICVGSPIAGRPYSEVEGMIGFFVNMLALRSQVSGEMSFLELLRQVKETTLDAYDHQDMPFEKIVEAVAKVRDIDRNPLFSVLFSVDNFPKAGDLQLDGLRITEEAATVLTSQFDLNMTIREDDRGLEVVILFCRDLYEEGTIARMAGHYEQLLRSAVADPARSVGDLPLLTINEEDQLLREFNDTDMDFPPGKTVVDLFGEQALLFPDHIALVFENEQVTYRELDQWSDRLSEYLRHVGVTLDRLVGICMERSADLVLGILSILKAGGAYVPIDPEYPPQRIDYLLSDTGVTVVLSNRSCRDRLGNRPDICVVEIDGDWSMYLEREHALGSERILAPVKAGPDNLAYVIYTSGSTGMPKGVMMEHKSLLNRLQWGQSYFRLQINDIVLQKTPFSFDVSVWELLWSITVGARLVIARPGGHRDNQYLIAEIESRGVTVIHFVPSMLEVFLSDLRQGECRSLRMVVCSGEALKLSQLNLFRQKLPGAKLYNLYGPTETAMEVTYWECPEHPVTTLPIGRPVSNSQVYILDKRKALAPIGVVGELCIGGVQVARGYWKKPELTAEKFIPDPFSRIPGERLYRSGDLARWLADGTIEYVGRVDEQVKIRGYRIELGEIETVLETCHLVRQAVVVAQEDAAGSKRLVAYIVPQGTFDREGIVSWLRGRLPEYMIPSLLMEMSALPLTSNGKINKKALPAVELSELLSVSYEAPRNAGEEKLVAIWQRLLGVKRVGIRDDFFALGGHSLLAIQLASQLKQAYSLDHFPLIELYRNPEIARLNILLDGMVLARAGKRPDHIVLLNNGKGDEPWFFIPGAYGTSDEYYELASAMGDQQPVYGLQYYGVYPGERPLDNLDAIIQQSMAWIRAFYPHGPYKLLGHSFGGIVAYEIARLFEQQGEIIERLVVMDVGSSIGHPEEDDFKWQLVSALEDFEERFSASWPEGWSEQLHRELPIDSCEHAWEHIVQFSGKLLGVAEEQILPFRTLFFLTFYNSRICHEVQGRLQHREIVLVKALESTAWTGHTRTLGWENHAVEVNVIETPGNHFTMSVGANAKTLAGALNKVEFQGSQR